MMEAEAVSETLYYYEKTPLYSVAVKASNLTYVNIKFHENQFSRSRLVECDRRTDNHGEDNCIFAI
jgi:hypothetical protein